MLFLEVGRGQHATKNPIVHRTPPHPPTKNYLPYVPIMLRLRNTGLYDGIGLHFLDMFLFTSLYALTRLKVLLELQGSRHLVAEFT